MEEARCEIVITLTRKEAKAFYEAMARAYNTWPGGNPVEQEILEELKLRGWATWMNLVLEDSKE